MELWHALNRGVDKRTIFEDSQDRARFVHDLFEFNDEKAAQNTSRSNMSNLRSRSLLVDIHGWCLMKNHYHLLLSERVDGGITKFIRKLNIGYAKYFNEKYHRSGTLFQGRTKRVLISSDAHFLHILHYLHLNPLDMLKETAAWRARRIASAARALTHLRQYRWSSYLDYCGKKNFPSVITTTLFKDVFGNYEQALASYLKDVELEGVQSFLLE